MTNNSAKRAMWTATGAIGAAAPAPEDLPSLQETVRAHALPLVNLAPIVDSSANASFVMRGEGSHGTHEFYKVRADITRRLIEEREFNAVVVEANWPEACSVDRFVRGLGTGQTPEEALSDFTGFPDSMWRNTDVRDFIAWLREWNSTHPQAGFHGMDLYSVEHSRAEAQAYDPQHHRTEPEAGDAAFSAAQNARVAENGAAYFRGAVRNSWNWRDLHMADTLDALAGHLRKRDGDARIAVWAHNSHIGDARATERAMFREWNVGQLMRERHPDGTILVGLTTGSGTVRAASNWGERSVVKEVRRPLPESIKRVFSDTGLRAFCS